MTLSKPPLVRQNGKVPLRSYIKQMPGFGRLYTHVRSLYVRYCGERYPRGHFYSPLPDLDVVRARSVDLFNRNVEYEDGIDLRRDAQLQLLQELAACAGNRKLPANPTDGARYYSNNKFFPLGCAYITAAMLLHFKPRRVIEIGSGFSSALMLDTNDSVDGSIQFTFIDPYPNRLLRLLNSADRERHTVIAKTVQEISLSTFESLEPNDILFVDSSHVAKIGSDVTHILFKILPKLHPGVIIHFHDIFWPFEYPSEWVIDEKKAWNESYFLRAFLQYNTQFEILLFPHYLRSLHRERATQIWNGAMSATAAALWIRRKIASN